MLIFLPLKELYPIFPRGYPKNFGTLFSLPYGDQSLKISVTIWYGTFLGWCYTQTVLHNWTVSGYSQDRTWNIMAISVGDEFETYESVKCKTEEIPA